MSERIEDEVPTVRQEREAWRAEEEADRENELARVQALGAGEDVIKRLRAVGDALYEWGVRFGEEEARARAFHSRSMKEYDKLSAEESEIYDSAGIER